MISEEKLRIFVLFQKICPVDEGCSCSENVSAFLESPSGLQLVRPCWPGGLACASAMTPLRLILELLVAGQSQRQPAGAR
jgi:hypothetical protein